MTGSLSRRAALAGGLALVIAPWTRPLAASAMPLAPLRIGVLADLTGPLATVGKEVLRGAQYRTDAINSAGGHGMAAQLELFTMDTASDPARVPDAAAELIEQGMHALVGGSALPSREALLAAGEYSCTPTIAPHVGPAPEQMYAFQSAPTIAQVLKALMKVASTGAKKVGLLSLDQYAPPAIRDAAQIAAAGAGLTLTGIEAFPVDATSVTTQVTALIAQQPDVLALNAPPEQAGIGVRDARAAGWTGPIVVTPDTVHPAFHATAAAAAEGVQAVAPWLAAPAQAPESTPNLATLRRFAEGFQAMHGAVSPFAGYGADAIALLNLAFLGHRDRKMARMQLEETCCVGVTGIFNTTPQHHAGLDDAALTSLVSTAGKWLPAAP